MIAQSFTWSPLIGGAIDGVAEQVTSVPVLVQMVGWLIISEEQRNAFMGIFTPEGWEQLKSGICSEVVATFTEENKRNHAVSKASVQLILAYYTLVSKAAISVAAAMDDVGKLAKKIDKTPALQRYLKKVVMDSALMK